MILCSKILTMSNCQRCDKRESAELISQDTWEPGQTEKHDWKWIAEDAYSWILEVLLLSSCWPNQIRAARQEGWGHNMKGRTKLNLLQPSMASCAPGLNPMSWLWVLMYIPEITSSHTKLEHFVPTYTTLLWSCGQIEQLTSTTYFLLKRWFIQLKKCTLTIDPITILNSKEQLQKRLIYF